MGPLSYACPSSGAIRARTLRRGAGSAVREIQPPTSRGVREFGEAAVVEMKAQRRVDGQLEGDRDQRAQGSRGPDDDQRLRFGLQQRLPRGADSRIQFR